MRLVFYIIFFCINVYAAVDNTLMELPALANKNNIENLSFDIVPQELSAKVIRDYLHITDRLIDLKKLRLVSRQFDLIGSKIFVEKIDVDHKLFMPWYVQMQLRFCDDQSLKKLFTSFDHESTIFNMLTHKFLFVSNIPKELVDDQNSFQNFCAPFNIQPQMMLDHHEKDLKEDIQHSIGYITHNYYVEQYNKKKHSLITFSFKDYQYTSIILPENIYFYIKEIIDSSSDYSLSFTVDDNNFEAHEQQKRKIYGKLISNIINKLSFIHDKYGEKVRDANKKLIPHCLIKKLKNISITFPILQNQWKKIGEKVSNNVFKHVHAEQNNDYKEKRFDPYFGKTPEKRGLSNIYLEYKLATKQLNVIDWMKTNEFDLNKYAMYLIKFLKEKIETSTWDDKLKKITEKTICGFIEKNTDGRYNPYLIDILNCTKNYILSNIDTSLFDFACVQNNYNIDLVEERYKNINIRYTDEDTEKIYKSILNNSKDENIKKEWIKKIPLNISLKNYIKICKEKKYARSLLYRKLNLKTQFGFFLVERPFFLFYNNSNDEIFLIASMGSLLYLAELYIACEVILKKYPKLNFLLRRALVLINLPWYPITDEGFFWKHWQKNVILEETKVI